MTILNDKDTGQYSNTTAEDEPAQGTPIPSANDELGPSDRPDPGTLMPTTEPPETVITLGRRDLQVLTVAPVVLGREGVIWFNIGSSGIKIFGADDAMAFTYWRDAPYLSGSLAKAQIEFGVVAGEIASIAEKLTKQTSKTALFVGLDLAVRPCAQEVIATPNKSFLTDGMPPEWCLLGGPESAEDAKVFYADKLCAGP